MWNHNGNVTPASQGGRPQKKLNLLTPWSWSFSLQSCEKVYCCCASHPVYIGLMLDLKGSFLGGVSGQGGWWGNLPIPRKLRLHDLLSSLLELSRICQSGRPWWCWRSEGNFEFSFMVIVARKGWKWTCFSVDPCGPSLFFYSFIHMCIHYLGHFSFLRPTSTFSPPLHFQTEPVLPLSLILLKRRWAFSWKTESGRNTEGPRLQNRLSWGVCLV
jgi:hypothetical protein